jgi:hypothetical protein
MTDHVYVNAARSELVPESAPGKKWQITRRQAVELGLLDAEEKPKQERRAFDASKAHVPPQRRRSPKKAE